MTHPLRQRLLRAVLGLIALALPFVAFAAAQASPTSAARPPEPASVYRGGLYRGDELAQVTSTPTPTASPTTTATSTATRTPTPDVESTQTAVAATQTAIAATQTAAAAPTSTTQFGDAYEPNNTLQSAYTISAGAVTGRITLWPLGDLDYFRFFAKGGSAFEVFTRDLQGDLDTILTVYDPVGNVIATNDDYRFGFRDSKVTFLAGVEGYFFARIQNKAPTDPTNKTYALEIKEVQPPTATPTPTSVPSIDRCDTNGFNNFSFDTACLFVADGNAELFDFVPVDRNVQDNDFFRVWVRQGNFYTCLTDQLGPLNDTNIIVYDQNRVGLMGNNDRDPARGDIRSEINYYATYTGWLYLLIGPVYPPEYRLASEYSYTLECDVAFITPTPRATATRTPHPPGTGGGGGFVPTAPPTPTPPPAPTQPPFFDTPTPTTPTPRPIVGIQPLATPTPRGVPVQSLSLNVTVYYDANVNFTPELDEGIMDVAVVVYDNATGQLLAFGYTNEAGAIRFGPLSVASAVRLEVPFLNYRQVFVSSEPDIRLRVAPTNLPGLIP